MTAKLYRADGVLDLALVNRKKIVHIVAGSLGSMVSDLLAYDWRQTVIIDPEALGPENIERHVLGHGWFEKSKVLKLDKPYKTLGMKHHLVTERGLDPDRIIAHIGTHSMFLDQHTDADLIIVSIDVPDSCEEINDWCVEHNKPALYGGVYPLGRGGQVAAITRPQEACYMCAEYLTGALSYRGKDVDYGLGTSQLIGREGKPHAVPALRAAIMMIAGYQASMALDYLMEGQLDPQIFMYGHSWKDLLIFTPKAIPEYLKQFIANLPGLGFLHPMRLHGTENGYAWQVRRFGIPMAIPRWDRCKYHNVL